MKEKWMKILEQYKEDGFDSVEVHLKNGEIFNLDTSKTILIASDKFMFFEKSKAVLIFEDEVKEIAI
ncbi:MAG: hypothetical protein ACRC6T_11590 [Sarcina sp.]